MAWNRREFLGLLAASGLGARASADPSTEFYPNSWLFKESTKQGFSILQGMTDETTTQFSVVVLRASSWAAEIVRRDGVPAQIEVESERVERQFSPYAVLKLKVYGLELGVDYVLRILDSSGGAHDERDFRTLDLSSAGARIAFVSCQLDLLHRDDIWKRLSERDPQMVMFVGDNVYADRTSFINKRPADEKQLWERYVLTRNRVAFYFQRKLTPVVATWDDHDYGADNAGKNYEYKDVSRVTFESFFAQSARPALVEGPGIAKKLSAFGADFFFLDGRSYRDEGQSEGALILGEEQENWLFSSIGAKPTWLINGSLFFGAYYSGESFEGNYTTNFKSFLKRLAGTAGTCCFVSGDVHFSEVMDIEPKILGYPTFEAVSSSMHSYTFPGHESRFSNPRRRITASAHNFVLFEGRCEGRSIAGELISQSAAREEFRTRVQVSR